jgi:NTE family protein
MDMRQKTNLPASQPTGPAAYECVALVLQGGGALGAYQGGVLQALQEAGIVPHWIAGISIGALNAAVIAGNPPARQVECLQAFWQDLCRPALGDTVPGWWLGAVQQFEGPWRLAFSAMDAWSALLAGQPAFFRPQPHTPWFDPRGTPATASFYDTSALQATLERHVDFDRLNHAQAPRVTMGAVQVDSGNLVVFDNRKQRLDARHVMASGALPPGFPGIEIEGRYYWDGGLVSNTPLAHVLHETPRTDMLVFQVDLWPARGRNPHNLMEVQTRQKDIQFSSRTRAITTVMAREQADRDLLRRVLAHVPPALRATDPDCRQAAERVTERVVKVVQLILRDPSLDGHFKDYDFGLPSMRQHWQRGLADTREALAQPLCLARPGAGSGFATHDAQAEVR